MPNSFENPNQGEQFTPKPERPTKPQRPVGGSGDRALKSGEEAVDLSNPDSPIKDYKEKIEGYKMGDDMDMMFKKMEKSNKIKKGHKTDTKRIERADII